MAKNEQTATTTDGKPSLWKRLVCLWSGHTFAAPSVTNWSGKTFVGLLAQSACVRCRRSFTAAYNENDGGNYR